MMGAGHRRFFKRGMGGGGDMRTWPMLALLLLVVLVAVGCVLWFLGEAMRNERTAIREKLAEAYRGHLSLMQPQMAEHWKQDLARMDRPGTPSARFADCVREGLAQSVICFDGAGHIAYPIETPAADGESEAAAAMQEQVRDMARSGDARQLARLVWERFPETDRMTDGQGRLVSANAELMALEALSNAADSGFQKMADRLAARAGDYKGGTMPPAQRRFVLHALQRLDGSREFPLLPAEDLAAEFLEANPAIRRQGGLHATELAGVWSVPSPQGTAVGLFTTAGLREKIAAMPGDSSLPSGVRLVVDAPGEDSMNDSVLATTSAGPAFPGWRLLISIDDRGLFDTEAEHRVKFLVLVACAVIAAIAALSIFVGRALRQQVKLARLKNDLVATVSHELKTPLAAMRALVDTLIDTERLDEKVTREYLQLIAAENARLSRLIENFLTFSRLERNKLTFHFKPLRPEQIVNAAVIAFGERARAPGCRLDFGAEPYLPRVQGDSDALTTTLLNLLDNAWKYTGDDKRISLRAARKNGSICFEVTDNGIGISPRERRRVFRTFYQADQRLTRTSVGCGLGLGIVRSIVEAHRGSVHVTSEPGHGSTFTVELPPIRENAT